MGEGMLSRVDALPAAVTRLTVAAVTGDTTLTVENASSFTPGTVDVDGTLVEVTGADGTTLDVVALTSGLDVDSPVVLLNAAGEPVTKLWATVDVPDSDAESGVYPLLPGIEWALPERSYDPPVPVAFGVIDGEEVVWLPGQARPLDPDTIGLRWVFGSLLTDQTIPDGVWTKITGWFAYTKGITPSFTPGNYIIEKAAIYDVSLGAQWYSNSTGRRACKVIRHAAWGDIDYFVDSRGATATAAMSTQTSDASPLDVGDEVSFWMLQTSGAGLDIIGPQCIMSITERAGGL